MELLVILLLFFAPPSGNSSVNEAHEIEDVMRQLANAWNDRQPETAAQFWTEDGDNLSSGGKYVKGPAELAALFRQQFSSLPKEAKVMPTIERVRLVKPDMAVVDGGFTLSTGGPPVRNFGVFARINGQWKILCMRAWNTGSPQPK